MSDYKPSVAYYFKAMVPLNFVVSGQYNDQEIVEAVRNNLDALYGEENWSLLELRPAEMMDLIMAGLVSPPEEDDPEEPEELWDPDDHLTPANDNKPTNVLPFKKTLN
jgi:hypothetical protein